MNNYITDLQLNIIYSSRKSISIELKPDAILVRAPKGMSRREINSFLNEKCPWIEKHLAKMQERKASLEQLPPFTMDEIRDLADKALVIHRKHMNHSADFYAEVERVFPEYRRCQKWLKENGGLYLSRLP